MRIRLILFICIGFVVSSLAAENNKPDSLKVLMQTASPEKKAKIMLQIGYLYKKISPDSSIKYLNDAIKLAGKNDLIKTRILGYLELAEVYNKYVKDINKTFEYYNLAEKYNQELNDPYLFAKIKLMQGRLYHIHFGDYEKALDCYFKSLDITDSISSDTASDEIRKQHINLLNSIGVVYYDIKNHEMSLKYYKENIEKLIDYGYEQYLYMFYGNVGRAFSELGALDSALVYFNLVYSLAQEKGIKTSAAKATEDIGIIYKKKGDYQNMLKYCKQALHLFSETEASDRKIIFINLKVGQAYMLLQKYDSAYPYLVEALRMAEASGSEPKIIQAKKYLSEYYAEVGNYKQAFQYQRDIVRYTDTIFQEELARVSEELQTKYETEKKEKEIAEQDLLIEEQKTNLQLQWIIIGSIAAFVLILILFFMVLFNRYRLKQKQHQTELEKRSVELEKKSVETEQRLLRSQMNPHFIFNSLSSVQNYISIDDKIAAMSFLSKFADLIRRILENSRESTIPLEDEINALELYCELEQLRLKNKFDFSIHVEEGLNAQNVFVPPMLVQPFVENAIKHGLKRKEEKGLLDIEFRKNQSVIYCIVRDNGIGRKATTDKKDKKHTSLALKIIQERLEVLEDVYEEKLSYKIDDLTDEQNNARGTEVMLTLPFETD